MVGSALETTGRQGAISQQQSSQIVLPVTGACECAQCLVRTVSVHKWCRKRRSLILMLGFSTFVTETKSKEISYISSQSITHPQKGRCFIPTDTDTNPKGLI